MTFPHRIRIKFGTQFQAINHRFDDQTNINGTFTFRSDAAFNANDAATWPERLSIRVPSPDNSFMPSKDTANFQFLEIGTSR